MTTPWALFQPLDRVLDAPRTDARTARATSSTWIGWVGVCGGAIGLLDVLVPGVLVPGWPSVIFAAMMIVLIVLGTVLLRSPQAGPRATTLLVLAGFPIYMVVTRCVVDAALYAPPLMMLFGAMLGAAMLSVRAFVINSLLLCCAVVTTLTPGWTGTTGGLIVQIGVQSAVLLSASTGLLLLRRRAEALLEHSWQMARVDSLTHLANRRRCAEYSTALPPGRPLAVAVLDLDHFKQANDAHGHAVGDQMLVAVGQALAEATQPPELPARIGGEEFLVLSPLPATGSADDESLACAHLGSRLRAAVTQADSPVPVTCSIGIVAARIPTTGADGEWLWQQVSRADRALYEAKAGGRDRVVALA